MSTTIYGIPNCDSVKKARRWLDGKGVDYRFHDVRSDGLDASQLRNWLAELGWETLINRRSSSWKQLDPALRESMNNERAERCILDMPTLIKRPLLVREGITEVGFTPERYSELFGA